MAREDEKLAVFAASDPSFSRKLKFQEHKDKITPFE
jgi:hypothetical protein